MVSLLVNSASAQEWKIELSYKYMYAKEWDKAIQEYNYSRPFLTEKQPLLIHGANASGSYIFKSEKHIKHGINLAYSYFRSAAENEYLDNTLHLHGLNLGYILQYENPEKSKGLYIDLIIAATSSALLRNVNGEPFVYDDSQSKAFGIGGDLSCKLGYRMALGGQSSLSPFVLAGYTPYMYSPNTEAVINETKGLVGPNWTSILSAQVGLAFHMKTGKKN